MGKYDKSIEQLLDVIGGKENIKNYEHCATRLRVVLKDDSKLDKEKADNIEESKGYFFSTGQHQFIFGTGKVNEVTKELDEYLGKSSSDDDGSMKDDIYANLNPVQKVVRILADILVPLIPALVTTGLLMGLRGLLVELGLEMTEDVAGLFAMLTDTAFAFLPVLIAYSATRKFGGNPLLGIVVGLMMVAPQLPNAYDVRGGSASPINIFGIDIYGYQGSIFPAILAGWMISKLDKWLRTWVPKVMDLIVTPFLTITITIGVILFLLGPIIQVIESFVIDGIVTLINAPLGIGYIVFGALQQLIVITGLHHSIGLIEITLLSDTGLNVIQPLTTVSMAGQFGAAIGTAFLMKDQVKRTNMISSAVPTLFGITEPLLFGVNMRSLRIFGSGIVAGAVGGFLIYLFDLAATGMGITFIPGLLLYTGSLTALAQYIIVSLAAFIVGFILVRLQGKAIREEV
ncbi:PTS transporter subunit EIIC [Aerococcaceae bacterium INB8]|uniref:PTS transporter subunit EIIC n=1 Tax=Ruoffia halotolerans TaxID=2748684 RepID=A0A839A7X0_9LACT|nr:PTS transporter subunit EIIC [Ruoffia halotolerans]MBA5730082.1 PTS transporter subunit EIIC [Ruoffia halotolerans]